MRRVREGMSLEIAQTRVRFWQDAWGNEREISSRNFRDLISEVNTRNKLKEVLIWSLIGNIAFIAVLIRFILTSQDISSFGKTAFAASFLLIGALPAWRLAHLFRTGE